MLRFRRMQSLQTLAALHGLIDNHFNSERTVENRQTFKDRRTGRVAETLRGLRDVGVGRVLRLFNLL